MCNRRPIRLLLTIPALACAIQAPVCPSWKSLGMGGAGVAVVSGIDAVHLNPAGLAQMGGKGSFHPLDTLGYKRDRIDVRLLSVGVEPDLDYALDVYRFWSRNNSTFDSASNDPLAVMKNQKLLDDLYKFDDRPLPVTIALETGLAFHDFGVSAWGLGSAILTFDHGAIVPKVDMKTQTTVAVEMATARSFMDERLSLGFGYRIAAVATRERLYDVIDLDTTGATTAAYRLVDSSGTDLRRSEDWGHGFDLGALWFQTPELRFGASARDIGMKLGGRFVVPNVSVGAAWAPELLQSNQIWWRRVDLAASLDDILYDTLGYKPLSKIDFGIGIEQSLIPMMWNLGVSFGFKGGYPTMRLSTTLFSAIQAELLTYGREIGYFTGDREERVWLARVGIGL